MTLQLRDFKPIIISLRISCTFILGLRELVGVVTSGLQSVSMVIDCVANMCQGHDEIVKNVVHLGVISHIVVSHFQPVCHPFKVVVTGCVKAGGGGCLGKHGYGRREMI